MVIKFELFKNIDVFNLDLKELLLKFAEENSQVFDVTNELGRLPIIVISMSAVKT
jgi:hypothetical protein